VADLDPRRGAPPAGREVSNYPRPRPRLSRLRPRRPLPRGLPDLQNGPESLIRGARAPIQHVGVSGFRLPIRYRLRDGGELALETAVTGT
jgi:GTP cyclohydrolase I